MRLRRFNPYLWVSTLRLCELDLSRQIINDYADAGLQVKFEVFFFTKIVLDAIIEFQFPDFGSFQVPNLLKPGFHGSTGITGPCKFILALILQRMSDSLHWRIPTKADTFVLTECMPYQVRWVITVHTIKTFMVAEDHFGEFQLNCRAPNASNCISMKPNPSDGYYVTYLNGRTWVN